MKIHFTSTFFKIFIRDKGFPPTRNNVIRFADKDIPFLGSKIMKRSRKIKKASGLVERIDPKAKAGGDVKLPPDYTVTSTTDGGGQLPTNVEVILCFWGSFWSRTPAPSPSSDQYRTAIFTF